MTLAAVFHFRAEEELNEAAAFYDSEVPGLSLVFLRAAQNAIDLIIEHPESAPKIAQSLRCKALSGFPYSLIYSIKPSEIRVLAVMHQKRRPFYWKRRK